jgi:hypothetical protein
MTTVPASRVMERNAVNKVKALLENSGHIVQEVDGQNDFGEDLYLTFVSNKKRTGDTVAVQVKGGVSYASGSNYRIRVGTPC